jgi:hypothetical protein
MGARGQEPIPVLRHARAHLRAFEILAQLLARLDQVGRQERLAIRALARASAISGDSARLTRIGRRRPSSSVTRASPNSACCA